MAIDLQKMLDVARSQIGYRESGTNHQKYSPAVPGLEWSQNQPWCATFTCWVFLQAGGVANEDFPLTASCLQQVAWGRQRGRIYSTPRVGDLALFGPGGGTHVEIVVGVSGSTITTIGGNTSGSWNGAYWNGDGVYQKSRAASSAYAYVRPVYGSNSSGGDEMPEFSWFSRDEELTLEPGRWTTVVFTRTSGKTGTFRDVVKGQACYALTASVVLDGKGLPAGTEVQMRASHYRRVGGLDLPSGIYRQGATGEAVRRIQSALIALGFSVGSYGADGEYGPATASAVAALQRAAGIDDDGVYGPQTRAAMDARAPGEVTQVMGGPISTSVHAGGNHHMTYSLHERVSAGDFVRVRVVQYGPSAVTLTGAKVTTLEWRG